MQVRWHGMGNGWKSNEMEIEWGEINGRNWHLFGLGHEWNLSTISMFLTQLMDQPTLAKLRTSADLRDGACEYNVMSIN